MLQPVTDAKTRIPDLQRVTARICGKEDQKQTNPAQEKRNVSIG